MLTGTFLALTAFLTAGATGCASLKKMSDTQKGAIIGAAGGAVVGGAVGKYAGSTTKGAIIGAVVGGAAGAVIGHRMDEKAKELGAELDNANVERVGEGILVTFESGLLFDFDSGQIRQQSAQLSERAGAARRRDPALELLRAQLIVREVVHEGVQRHPPRPLQLAVHPTARTPG
ncbi:MAG: glycine zipper 2TM domain-containing protein [Gemmatimonadetes bacterium]|nr:glycine zipper 2TM domain-containing protein [Gemmatimonadota bacterium]